MTHPQNGSTVLIVDDEPVIRAVVAFQCKRAGHVTTLAEDGVEALHSTQTSCFDLIITDYQMPVMNGVEFCRLLRLDEGNSNQNTPIIMSTANLKQLDTSALELELRPIRFSGKPLESIEFSGL